MPTVTLATRIYHESQLRQANEILKNDLQGLMVRTTPAEANPRGWLQLTISGEDEAIGLNYLTKEFGLCPTKLEDIRKYSSLRGYIKAADKETIYADVGISSPAALDVRIPVHRLQSQLTDGRKVALKRIVELYGLITNLPLTVKISSSDRSRFEAELDEQQVRQYARSIESLLDRLIILGVPRGKVELVLRNAALHRDVVSIQDLGLLEHSIVCKLGTDAVGLIPKIGRRLQGAAFAIFSPRRIIKFLGRYDDMIDR